MIFFFQFVATFKHKIVHLLSSIIFFKQETFFHLNLLNPIRAGMGVIIDLPLVFFYSHFICVRARYLTFYDFLNNVRIKI